MTVLWENSDEIGHNRRWSGLTDNYIRVIAHGPEDLLNRVTRSRLSNSNEDGMTAIVFS